MARGGTRRCRAPTRQARRSGGWLSGCAGGHTRQAGRASQALHRRRRGRDQHRGCKDRALARLAGRRRGTVGTPGAGGRPLGRPGRGGVAGNIASVRHSAAEIGAAGRAARRGGRLPEVAAALVIAVDGPSGSGKSSAAKGAAVALGLRYLDTGAMYRAVTWWMLEHDVDLTDPEAVAKHATCLTVDVSTDPGDERIVVDGTDVTASIRQRRVSNAVSLVAAIPRVR